jgi:endonuclease YncB( thermonuclease family)
MLARLRSRRTARRTDRIIRVTIALIIALTVLLSPGPSTAPVAAQEEPSFEPGLACVTAVVDGDTILVDGFDYPVTLAGIKAPGILQPYGVEAAEFLLELFNENCQVLMEPSFPSWDWEEEAYRAWIWIEVPTLGFYLLQRSLVWNGLAVVFPLTVEEEDPFLRDAQTDARIAGRNIWPKNYVPNPYAQIPPFPATNRNLIDPPIDPPPPPGIRRPGGLGMLRIQWEVLYGPPQAVTVNGLYAYQNDTYLVGFFEDHVWYLERRWPITQTVTIDVARTEGQWLSPTDASLYLVVGPQNNRLIDLWTSPSLAETFVDETIWVAAGSGSFNISYRLTFEGRVYGMTLQTGHNP